MKKVLIDTNILLVFLENREPFFDDALNLMISCANRDVLGYVSASSMTDLYYLIRKSTGSEDMSRDIIRKICDLCEMLDTTGEDIFMALASPMRDYEDAVLAESARRAGIEHIITRNLKDYAASPVPAVLPGEFMTRHLD